MTKPLGQLSQTEKSDKPEKRETYWTKTEKETSKETYGCEILVENGSLDEVMTKLRTLVQETDIALIVVSHLRRPDGKGHEEGAVTSLAQLRGSGSIAQLSDMVLGLERDSQNEDVAIRNTTTLRVLKNRFVGMTGPACYLYWDKDTGRLNEVDKPQGDETEEDKF